MTERKENLIQKAYENSDDPYGHLMESERIKIERRYNSLAYKVDTPQNFQPSKNYPNINYERPIYCLEDVYEEV